MTVTSGPPTVEQRAEAVFLECETTADESAVDPAAGGDTAVLHTPVVLAAHDGLEQAALRHGTFSPDIRAAIAISVGAVANCAECQDHQTVAGRAAGWTTAQIVAMRTGEPITEETGLTALLAVARQVAQNSGSVPEQIWQEALRAGWTRAELAELFVQVIVNLFTNCLSHYARATKDSAAGFC